MKLLDYLKENNLTDADFAAHLGGGLSEGAVRKWKYGERTPRLRDLARIEQATNGSVRPNDFLPENGGRPFRPECASDELQGDAETPRAGEAAPVESHGANETAPTEITEAAE